MVIVAHLRPEGTYPQPHILILSSHLRLNVPSGLFAYVFLLQCTYIFCMLRECYTPQQVYLFSLLPQLLKVIATNYKYLYYQISSVMALLQLIDYWNKVSDQMWPLRQYVKFGIIRSLQLFIGCTIPECGLFGYKKTSLKFQTSNWNFEFTAACCFKPNFVARTFFLGTGNFETCAVSTLCSKIPSLFGSFVTSWHEF